jgi:putative ABC transport system ATP-binding protein
MIRLAGIEKRYDAGQTTALSIDDLEIGDGENVAIVGRSGSGKTTLLNLMSGLDTPDRGEIWFGNRRVGTASEWTDIRAGRVGMVFQNFCLLADFNVCENIALGMMPREASPRRRSERVAELVRRFELTHVAAKFPPVLSGGERQRVAIARAIANRPSLLLADEPTGSLDSATGAVIIDNLVELNVQDGCTLVVVTHDEAVAARASRRIVLKDGKIVSDTKADGVRR